MVNDSRLSGIRQAFSFDRTAECNIDWAGDFSKKSRHAIEKIKAMAGIALLEFYLIASEILQAMLTSPKWD